MRRHRFKQPKQRRIGHEAWTFGVGIELMCVHVFGCVADQDLDRFPLALALIDMHPEKQAAFFELLMQAFRALVLEPACKAEADDAACPSGKRGGAERSPECS